MTHRQGLRYFASAVGAALVAILPFLHAAPPKRAERTEPAKVHSQTTELNREQEKLMTRLRQQFSSPNATPSGGILLEDMILFSDNEHRATSWRSTPDINLRGTSGREHYFLLGPNGEKGLVNSNEVAVRLARDGAPTKQLSVMPSVLRFADAFWTGAHEPNKFLEIEALRQGSISTITTHIFRWISLPQSKRIFISGANSDLPQALRLQKLFESEGYSVFFYMRCKPLCNEATVGAFFGSAGTAIHIQSPTTPNSQFVPVEVAMALAIDAKGPMPTTSNSPSLLVLDTREILLALANGKSAKATRVDCKLRFATNELCQTNATYAR